MRKKLIRYLLLSVSINFGAKAQVKTGHEGLFIKSGTIVSVEGLVMTPATDLVIHNNSISKVSSPILWPKFSGINRVYLFNMPVNLQGEISLYYQDAELNSNTALKLAYTSLLNSSYINYTIATASQNNFGGHVSYNFPALTAIAGITAVIPVNDNPDLPALAANNILSPNGDGINDKLVFKNISAYSNNGIKIFDAGGKLLYSKNNYNNEWDGTYRGEYLETGTYYYILESSESTIKKGLFTIVRDK